MAFWKQKHNQTDGFSLVEVVVAITILGFVVVPMMSGLLFSYRLNQRSDDKLQAQLAVSSAVETIMAEGYNPAWYVENGTENFHYNKRFPDVKITADLVDNAYKLHVVAYNINAQPDESGKQPYYEDIFVDTYARPYVAPEVTDGDASLGGGGT